MLKVFSEIFEEFYLTAITMLSNIVLFTIKTDR